MAISTLLLEFLHPTGEAVVLSELGFDFIERQGLPIANSLRPFRVEIEGKSSKAGNTFFSYEHTQVTLPDGLNTVLRAGGVLIKMEPERLSKSGNPTRAGRATLTIGGLQYDVIVYLTKGSKPYWVKVHAQKQKASRAGKGVGHPKIVGGHIV